MFQFIADQFDIIVTATLGGHFTELSLNVGTRCVKCYGSVQFCLRMNSQDKWEILSITVKKYLDPSYDFFGMGAHTSVCINSKTSIDLELTALKTLYLDFDKAHR
jgi:hypothetical protein